VCCSKNNTHLSNLPKTLVIDKAACEAGGIDERVMSYGENKYS
jgi:hypothetical protein